MIILASASPRRQELLQRITTEFLVLPADVDETLPAGIAPADAVSMLSQVKARAIAETYPNDLVIGADTVVAIGSTILGKPTSPADAKRMLRLLSGKTHQVLTGVTLCKQGRETTFVTQTDVTFYPLTSEEMDRYVASGEPMDKAGAYGIQEQGSLFVKEIHGDYFNVVGLPVAALSRQLFE